MLNVKFCSVVSLHFMLLIEIWMNSPCFTSKLLWILLSTKNVKTGLNLYKNE